MSVYPYMCRFEPADIEAALRGRYSIDSEIATGGQGVVFKATRTAQPDGTPANDIVALKLHFDRRQNTVIEPEITAAEDFSHPNLARLIEYGTSNVGGRHTRYVAWEFIEGQTLSVLLKNGPMMESDVLAIGRDVSAAIAAIWSKRIVHGDIKPSNIMLRNSDGHSTLDAGDVAVLIDLGAAKYLGHCTHTIKRLDGRDRRAAKPIGTLGYFSPEQLQGSNTLSCASDVFSLGVVMLQCLLGRHPTNYDQVALAEGVRTSGGKVAANVSLLTMLEKMLSPRPTFRPSPAELSQRFRSLRQMMDAQFTRSSRVPMDAQY